MNQQPFANESLLTSDEYAVLEALGQAWNVFQRLPPGHPDDQGEFRHAIHAAQNIVMARAACREDKK